MGPIDGYPGNQPIFRRLGTRRANGCLGARQVGIGRRGRGWRVGLGWRLGNGGADGGNGRERPRADGREHIGNCVLGPAVR